jgi:hypothetical protein
MGREQLGVLFVVNSVFGFACRLRERPLPDDNVKDWIRCILVRKEGAALACERMSRGEVERRCSGILMIRGFSFVTMSRSSSIANVLLGEGMMIGEEGRRLRQGCCRK